jgi:uncharacterized membrane protein YfcA
MSGRRRLLALNPDPAAATPSAGSRGRVREMLGLEGFVSAFGGWAVAGAALALGLGGFAKGVVGFALPLVALSGMGSFLPFETAVALLILPTVVANVFQSLRDGVGAALGSFRSHWRLILPLMVMITLSAQLLVALPDRILFGGIGLLITLFAISQLAGWRPRIAQAHRRAWQWATGLVGGFVGGIAGIWGPPVVMYLIATDTPKVETVRVQALCFLFGALVLVGAHVASGVLNPVTAPMSAWLVLPTVGAMFAGYLIQDRLDQRRFRAVTLMVLVAAGINLLRRAATG